MMDSKEKVASTWEDLGSIRDYRLVARLGQGGMGTVYRALHVRLGKVVAVKVLPPDMMQPDAVSRFQREMKAVGKLHHPNIVQAFDAGEHEDTHFLVMECVDGCDLATLVKQRGPLSVADACEIIRQAAVGLQHAHQHGLVHRDVKPSNLMLSEEGQVKLLDLGLALIQGPSHQGADLTMAAQIMGTPDFLAPEQASDSHSVDIRADIYSLGCTLYYLLSGAPPYLPPEFRTPMQKITAHLTRPFPDVRRLRSDATEALANIMERMIAKDPANRFATPGEVASAIAPLAIGGNLVRIVAPGDETQSEGEPATLRPDITRSALEDTSRPAVTTAHLGSAPMPAKPSVAPLVAAAAARLPARRRSLPFVALAAAAAALLIAAAVTIFRIQTKEGTLIISVDGPGAVVTVDGETAKVVLDPDARSYRIATRPGTHSLVVTTPDGLKYTTDNSFTVEEGGETRLTARLEKADAIPSTATIARSPIKDYALDFSPTEGGPPLKADLAVGLTTDQPFTIEMIVMPRTTAPPKENRAVWELNNQIALKQYGANWEFLAFISEYGAGEGNNKYFISIPARSGVVPGQRTFLAGVSTGSEIRFFVNGKKIGAAPITSVVNRSYKRHFVGTASAEIDGWTLFDGTIDEIRLSTIARYSEDYTPRERLETDKDTFALYHCDEGEGDVLTDSSGNNRHGKIVGARWTSADSAPKPIARSDFALDFSVTESAPFPSVTLTEGLEAVQPLTVEMLVVPRSIAPPRENLGLWDLNNRLTLKENGARWEWLLLSLKEGASSNKVENRLNLAVASKEAIQPGQRVYLAGVAIGTEIRFFVNGKQAGARSFASLAPTTEKRHVLGAPANRALSGWSPFNGTIDEVRISTIARYSEDYTPRERLETDKDTFALYHCDEGQGDVLTDSSGNNRHGKIVGAKWVREETGGEASLIAEAKKNQPKSTSIAPPAESVVATPSAPASPPATDQDRIVAQWLLDHGGSVSLQRGANVVEVSAGNTLPQAPHFITKVSAPEATSVDMERLVGLTRLTSLSLPKSAVDAAAVPHLSQLRTLKSLYIAETKLSTSDLAGLRGLTVLSSLTMSNAQLNDHWQFLRELASLRLLTIHGRSVRELEKLAAFPQLRFVHFPSLTTVDENVVDQIQKANPYIRLIVGYDEKTKSLGRDPQKEAARRLISKGVVILGYPFTKYARKPLTLQEVDGELPIMVLGINIPAGVHLSAEERQLLTCFDGSYDTFNAVGLREADAAASMIASNGTLWGINLSESDLSDAGLSHLQRLAGLLGLDVSKTKVTAAGVQALQKAVPNCQIVASAK